ncbi:hypothetical protein R1flu_024388 [Riccia fluitans]|uniref:Uncharacterized protein n=1 Tax=Riccia fluitans TaxID=41844 RepID=A0ABD1XUR5_9MARC
MASSADGRRILRRPRRKKSPSRYAISEAEDECVIRKRLLTKTVTMTCKADPPLNTLLQKFFAFSEVVKKDTDDYEEWERLHAAFLQELDAFALPLTKSEAVVEVKKREIEGYIELHARLKEQVAQCIYKAKVDVECSKLELEEARKINRKPYEESEAIRRQIMSYPTRSAAQEKLREMQKELDLLEEEDAALAASVECRKTQFSILLQAVDDLQMQTTEAESSPSGDYEHCEDPGKLGLASRRACGR